MRTTIFSVLLMACAVGAQATSIVKDLADVHPGPIQIITADDSISVEWSDKDAHQWRTQFSLDSAKPLITLISVDGKAIVVNATPVYRCTTQ